MESLKNHSQVCGVCALVLSSRCVQVSAAHIGKQEKKSSASEKTFHCQRTERCGDFFFFFFFLFFHATPTFFSLSVQPCWCAALTFRRLASFWKRLMRRLSSVVRLDSVGVCAAVTAAHDKPRWKKVQSLSGRWFTTKEKKNIHFSSQFSLLRKKKKKGKTRSVCEEIDKNNGRKIGETRANCSTASPSLLTFDNVFKCETTKLSSKPLVSSKVTTKLFHLLGMLLTILLISHGKKSRGNGC